MTYPILEIHCDRNPQLAENIWHAQKAGHPDVLTYCGPALGKDNRKEAMHFELDGIRQEIMHILSRDEYPFACTLEGGRSSWVGHIPSKENSSQGGLIAAFLRKHGIQPWTHNNTGSEKNCKFKVVVIGYPKGTPSPPLTKRGTVIGI